jgi:hypothetical protein
VLALKTAVEFSEIAVLTEGHERLRIWVCLSGSRPIREFL